MTHGKQNHCLINVSADTFINKIHVTITRMMSYRNKNIFQ